VTVEPPAVSCIHPIGVPGGEVEINLKRPPVLLLAEGVAEAIGVVEVGTVVADFEVAGTGAVVLVMGAAVATG